MFSIEHLKGRLRCLGVTLINMNWEQYSDKHLTGYIPFQKMLIKIQQSFRSKKIFKNCPNTLSLFFSILHGDVKGYILSRMYFSFNVWILESDLVNIPLIVRSFNYHSISTFSYSLNLKCTSIRY